MALVDQLAPGGRLLVHITTRSPSWPALAVVERDEDGQLHAELRAVEFAHRAGHGMRRIFLTEEFRHRIANDPETWTQRSKLAPPPDTDRGFWLAADHALGGGLVRDFQAEHLVIGAPDCGSWLRVEPTGRRRWTVRTNGPRDIWKRSRTSPYCGAPPAAPTATACSSIRPAGSKPHRNAAVCPGNCRCPGSRRSERVFR